MASVEKNPKEAHGETDEGGREGPSSHNGYEGDAVSTLVKVFLNAVISSDLGTRASVTHLVGDELNSPDKQCIVHSVLEQVRAQLHDEIKQEVQQRVAELMSHIRHDLKTPLTTSILHLSLVRMLLERLLKMSPDDNADEYRELMEHLNKVMNSMRSFADALALGSDNLNEVQLRRLSSNEILNRLRQYDQNQIRGPLQSDVEMIWDFPQEDIMFIGDNDKITSMLHILIDNAVKFTHQGTIRVTLELTNQELVIQVADTGCGIPQDKLHTIFQKGVSLSQEETPAIEHSPKPSGLGLYYVTEFCRVLGGMVEVSSQPKQGTTFKILLPLHSEADLRA